MDDSPFMSASEGAATAKTAAAVSIVCPGLGHILMGKVGQGIAIFVVWAAMIGWIILKKGDLNSIHAAVGGSPKESTGFYQILFPLAVAIIVHLGAIISCSSRARSAGKKTIEHPTPPMNLPFE
jgi:TM2 domain-containing membrane protein YozV